MSSNPSTSTPSTTTSNITITLTPGQLRLIISRSNITSGGYVTNAMAQGYEDRTEAFLVWEEMEKMLKQAKSAPPADLGKDNGRGSGSVDLEGLTDEELGETLKSREEAVSVAKEEVEIRREITLQEANRLEKIRKLEDEVKLLAEEGVSNRREILKLESKIVASRDRMRDKQMRVVGLKRLGSMKIEARKGALERVRGRKRVRDGEGELDGGEVVKAKKLKTG